MKPEVWMDEYGDVYLSEYFPNRGNWRIYFGTAIFDFWVLHDKPPRFLLRFGYERLGPL